MMQSIRITSGEFRGREVKSPLKSSTHPMGSRERLALFNSIGPDIQGAVVLDAFAGTGALGFEALSRGAAHVTFIEKDKAAAQVIAENIRSLGVESRTRLFKTKVEAMEFESQFDFVIADPPYDFFGNKNGSAPKVSIKTLNSLASSASNLFILSHPDNFDPHVLNASLKSTRSYAAARISIFTA